jgi:ubiquinone/menaquinone biosynthesis C-methylase UbiE
MVLEPSELQLDWDDDALRTNWPARRHDYHLIMYLEALTPEIVLEGGAHRVLDVAAAQAGITCAMSTRGVRAIAFDPSLAMLAAARRRMKEQGTEITLVRGIAETMPFRDHSFDRVLCHSAIDHVADPDLAVREMTRVLEPGGRLILSGVNYEGASARICRLLYRAGRGLGLVPHDRQLVWDTPVPAEHTFECSYARLRQLCEPYLELERAHGVSFGWGLPLFTGVIERLPNRWSMSALDFLNSAAYGAPVAADFIYTVWRPRPRSAHPRRPIDGGFVVQPHDVVYPYKRSVESAFWGLADFDGTIMRTGPAAARMINRAYSGDAARSWLDDLIGRGPFGHAAVLGCDEDRHDAEWMRRGASSSLDIYELSPHVIRKVRSVLGTRRDVRFIEADLNFATLPAERYDVIWSSGCLHHIVNLEHLFAEVERALRPGGLFALHDYVGDARFQYDAKRLARVTALLREIPARFRHGDVAEARDQRSMSPFCGVRPRDVLPLAEAHFDVVHKGLFGALLPLTFYLDLEAIAREDPALLERLEAEEEQAARDPALQPCSAYAVFRKRSAAPIR